MKTVLYISYDGVLEPLGQSQVLSYLEHLAKGRVIYLISFEKSGDWSNGDIREIVQQRVAMAGIRWYPLRYHKRLSILATAFDVVHGFWVGLLLSWNYNVGIVHARSYVPAIVALILKPITGVKFVFDMRGFWADERVDGGMWRRGRMYRLAKWFERQFLTHADHVVSLTNAAVSEIKKFPYLRDRCPPITVIPTCANLSRFRRPDQRFSGDGFVLGYVGSVGTWYLFDPVAASFRQLLVMRPDARLVVINRNDQVYIRDCLITAGVPESAFELRAVQHAEIPQEMARMHAGIFFIKPAFSKIASAPTRLAEFLGCGIPCLVNSGVGDMAELLRNERVGVVVDDLDGATLEDALRNLLALAAEPATAARCAAAARRHFALEEGVARYEAIYRSLQATT